MAGITPQQGASLSEAVYAENLWSYVGTKIRYQITMEAIIKSLMSAHHSYQMDLGELCLKTLKRINMWLHLQEQTLQV